jgi:hypothetical protein
MYRFVWIASLLVAVLVRAETPGLKLDVLQGDKAIASSATAVVTNIDYIRVRATIAPDLVQESTMATSQAAPAFDVTVTSTADGSVVPIRHSLVAFSTSPSGASIDFVLEIPVPVAERRSIVEGFIDEVIHDASADERRLLLQQRQQAIAAIERLFVQNRVGDYVICFQLTNPRIDVGSGAIPLRVVQTGTFADRLKERPPQPGTR